MPAPAARTEREQHITLPFQHRQNPFGESKCRRFTRSNRIAVSYSCKIVCISIGSGCAHYILLSLSLTSTRALSKAIKVSHIVRNLEYMLLSNQRIRCPGIAKKKKKIRFSLQGYVCINRCLMEATQQTSHTSYEASQVTSRGKALHVNKGMSLIAKDDLPMSFVPKDQNVNL